MSKRQDHPRRRMEDADTRESISKEMLESLAETSTQEFSATETWTASDDSEYQLRPLPDSEQFESHSLAGHSIGDYHLSSHIGEGELGSSFLAYHQLNRVPVRITIFDPSLVESKPELLTMMMDEAYSARVVSHPNLVRVFDCDEIDGFYLVVQEYVDGFSLSELLQLNGPLPSMRALVMMRFVASGLAAALEHNVLHGDIKPSNIIVTKSRQVKLNGLGVSRVQTHTAGLLDSYSVIFKGTPYYCAPEVGSSEGRIDHRSDIYALGATLYHSVTGTVPFRGMNRAELIARHREEPIVPPSDIDPDIGKEASKVICRMMEKDPDRRQQGYQELIAHFEDAIEQTDEVAQSRSKVKTIQNLLDMFGGAAEA